MKLIKKMFIFSERHLQFGDYFVGVTHSIQHRYGTSEDNRSGSERRSSIKYTTEIYQFT